MTYRGFTLVCLLALAGVVGRARADVAVMVPPRSDQAPAGSSTESATEELSRLLRLQGFDVISDGQAGAYAEAEQQRGVFPRSYDAMFCITPECANEYRKLFDGLFAVQLTISNKNGRPASVTIVLTESPKAFFGASARVEGGDVRAALRVAFEEAREKQKDGAGPWLVVSGDPEGAAVYLDNDEFGRVPLKKRRVEPGRHQLEVRADGFMSDTRTLNIATNIDHVETVAVTLKRLDEPVARYDGTAPRRIHRSPWDWALGGTLAAVGAAHLVAGIYQKTKDGECAERMNGQCTELYGTGSGVARDNMLIGFGAAGVAAGALVMGFGPIGALSFRADREHAMLQLKGKF